MFERFDAAMLCNFVQNEILGSDLGDELKTNMTSRCVNNIITV